MIYLIRHGQTAFNAAAVVQPADTPLDERGVYQAGRLAARLSGLGVAHVLASDLPRAVMTAEPIVQATGASLELSPLLRERNFGDDCGKSYAELGPGMFQSGYQPPNGEGAETFDRRVRKAWELVVDARRGSGGDLAVVTHGLVCRSLCFQCVELEPGTVVPEVFINSSVTTIEPTSPHRVHLLDCAAHLDRVGLP